MTYYHSFSRFRVSYVFKYLFFVIFVYNHYDTLSLASMFRMHKHQSFSVVLWRFDTSALSCGTKVAYTHLRWMSWTEAPSRVWRVLLKIFQACFTGTLLFISQPALWWTKQPIKGVPQCFSHHLGVGDARKPEETINCRTKWWNEWHHLGMG